MKKVIVRNHMFFKRIQTKNFFLTNCTVVIRLERILLKDIAIIILEIIPRKLILFLHFTFINQVKNIIVFLNI